MSTSIGVKFAGRCSILSLLAPAIAALVFLTTALPAQAATPPSGSYRQSCNDIKASSRVLKARCQTRNRTFVRTSLAGYRNCMGDIANANGQLVCRAVQGDITLYEHTYFRGRSLAVTSDVSNLPRWFSDIASSVRVRRGSWQVCTDWGYRGRCQVVRRDIDNLNRIGMNDRISSLRSVSDPYPGGGGGQYGPPQGSYLQSCRDATFDGRYLSAACRDRRGRYEVSRLDVRACDRGDDIINRDGELSCEDRRGDDDGHDQDDNTRLPRGSYQQTCRNASIDRDMLRAECQDHNGNWRRTGLNVDNCRNDIANDNGELRCTGVNPPPPPAPLPGGSYQQSCRNMVFARGTLSGECRNAGGEWRNTSLDMRSCLQGADIGNANGQLTCAGANPPPLPAPLPGGSYQQSCRNMVFARGTLSGECRNAGGEWRATSLDTRTCTQGADIGNDNGTLKCASATPPPPPPVLPAGSYQQSCRNMAFARGTLSGECRNAGGEWRATTLDTRTCTQGADIGNDNGTLKCAGATPPPPPPGGPRPTPVGSYQTSCRNIAVERGTLNAECQDASGAWKQTSIELRSCRGAPDIANDNGALKCSPPPAP